MDKNNLTMFPGAGNPDVVKEALRQMDAAMEDYIHFLNNNAKLLMAKFKAIKNEGFTDQQAIELCKGPIFNLG